MADYQLSHLTSRSFEKLVQSIAGRVLGAGTTTFGDGPDGGREATFEGRMDYPSAVAPWEGYCVIQAKFLQRPKDSTSDGQWAFKQLESELKAFANSKSRRRRPDYFVFATNVVLSPTLASGGKDKLGALFNKYRRRLQTRDWGIWDFDEIGKFLDMFQDIRRAYAAWITSGDVLSEMLERLAPQPTAFLDVATNFLAKELRSDQFANLEQAGHSTEERIRLARVFVDLPVRPQRTTEPFDQDYDEGQPGIVATLVDVARDVHDAASGQRTQDSSESRPDLRPHKALGPIRGRYVLIGGPGQGKTTVGQFACQLFRAALLKDRPRRLLAPEVCDTLTDVFEQCTAARLNVPAARRFPVRIVLSEFADALNADKTLTLLGFLARHIESRTGTAIAVSDLRRWLATYPWFLVLDGLDEVPASTNRDEVLKKVEDFWIDAYQVDADVLVLATTRPQGYSDDFSPAYYSHLWLAPLSTARAMVYAERLVAVRYAGEPDRQLKILGRLQQASLQKGTARLMRSPLQVTIMAALVSQAGTPPQDRWSLFHDYYEVIYNREKERPIKTAELLRTHKSNIDAIHHQVGFVLQIESERAGATDAKLSASRFNSIVVTRLEEEGFRHHELRELADRVTEAATNRLVFLVGLESGQVGFEIRSLQEYMAAEALMTGDQADIQNRLRHFAPTASWRNVFLFAAGRCFSRDQHLRDTVCTICAELDDQLAGALGKTTRAGATLALDLIEDGVVRLQPKYARLLAGSAIHLLDLPPSETHGRLAAVCEGDIEPVLREALQLKLAAPTPSQGAWATLGSLVGRRLTWARALTESFYPQDASQQLTILSLSPNVQPRAWGMKRFKVALFGNPPSAAGDLLWRLERDAPRRQRARPFYALLTDGPQLTEARYPEVGLTLRLALIETAREAAQRAALPTSDMHPGWIPTLEELSFCRSPSHQTLADALRRIALNTSAFFERGETPRLSWVFDSCLDHARSPGELIELSSRISRGDCGTLHDWLGAEQRWLQRGIGIGDLLSATDESLPFDRNIDSCGFPLDAAYVMPSRESLPDVLPTLNEVRHLPKVETTLARWLVRAFLSASDSNFSVDPRVATTLLRVSRRGTRSFAAILAAARMARTDERWLEFLDEEAKVTPLPYFVGSPRIDGSLVDLMTLQKNYPERMSLLKLLAAGLVTFRVPPATKELLAALPCLPCEQYESPADKWTSLILELFNPNLTTARAEALASVTATLSRDDASRVPAVASALSKHDRFDDSSEAYLLRLFRELTGEDWENKRTVMTALNSSLRRHGSGALDQTTWLSLNLPTRLFPLVSERG